MLAEHGLVLCPAVSPLFRTSCLTGYSNNSEEKCKIWPSSPMDCEQQMVRSISLLESPFSEHLYVFLKNTC